MMKWWRWWQDEDNDYDNNDGDDDDDNVCAYNGVLNHGDGDVSRKPPITLAAIARTHNPSFPDDHCDYDDDTDDDDSGPKTYYDLNFIRK